MAGVIAGNGGDELRRRTRAPPPRRGSCRSRSPAGTARRTCRPSSPRSSGSSPTAPASTSASSTSRGAPTPGRATASTRSTARSSGPGPPASSSSSRPATRARPPAPSPSRPTTRSSSRSARPTRTAPRTTLDDTVAPFSSAGPTTDGVAKPDVLAPGVSIVSDRAPGSTVDAFRPTARLGATMFKGSGTSQAAAVVAGVAARMLDVDPTLTNDEIKGVLAATADQRLAGPGAGAGVDRRAPRRPSPSRRRRRARRRCCRSRTPA